MTEWFREIPGFPDYNVSNYGRVVNIINLRPAFTHKNEDGYLVPQLYASSGKQAKPVHLLMADAFLGGVPENRVLVHLDGDITNNDLSNLDLQFPDQRVVIPQGRVFQFMGHNRKLRDKTIRPAKNSIPIRVVDTGREFPSIQHAARAMKIDPKMIAAAVHGKRPHARGHRFERVEVTK